MAELPPPTGQPVHTSFRVDRWAEQARRREEYQRRRRQRRLTIAAVVGGVLMVGLAGLVGVLALRDEAAPAPTTIPSTSSTSAPTSAVPSTPPVTVAPTDLVTVDEVWLVDRGDGVFDWGVTVFTPPLAPSRSSVEIDVRLLDAADEVVINELRILDGVDEDSAGAAVGQLVEPRTPPVRIEFDITVGDASNDDAFDEQLEVRGLVRREDALTGRFQSLSDRLVTGVVAAFVWRDELGDVIGMALQEIDEIRPGSNERFELDLSDVNLPDGRPDDVFWSATN